MVLRISCKTPLAGIPEQEILRNSWRPPQSQLCGIHSFQTESDTATKTKTGAINKPATEPKTEPTTAPETNPKTNPETEPKTKPKTKFNETEPNNQTSQLPLSLLLPLLACVTDKVSSDNFDGQKTKEIDIAGMQFLWHIESRCKVKDSNHALPLSFFVLCSCAKHVNDRLDLHPPSATTDC